MAIQIGVFATSVLVAEKIKQVTETLSENCEFTFMPYDSMKQLCSIYKQRSGEFDGLLFSGPLGYKYLISRYSPPSVSNTCIEISDQDYYQAFLKILYRNPRLEVQRILIEAPSTPIPWEEVFEDPAIRPIMWTNMKLVDMLQTDSLYSDYFQEYRRLWTLRQADFFCTRLVHISPQLTAAGIPHALLFPSRHSILSAISRLLNAIRNNEIVDSRSAVGLLKPSADFSEREIVHLQNLLTEYNHQSGTALTFQSSPERLLIFTTSAAVHQSTQNYTHCQLAEFLQKRCDFPFALGWGVGDDVLAALHNAEQALCESLRSGLGPYIVTKPGDLIGPLVSGKSVSISTAPIADALSLSKLIGVTPASCQKLLTLASQQSRFLLTRNELAMYLNVTPRTANRILTKLTELSAARIVASKQKSSAGRPLSVYEIQLEVLLSTA